MAQDGPDSGSPRRKQGLLKDQVRLVKRKDSGRHEIVPFQEPLSFEKGFFIVIRACQLLAQNNDGIILVGLAGPSGAGKTCFTEKIMNFMPSIAVISMDNYNDASRIVDGNFDDPRLTDYDALLQNIKDLKAGKEVQVYPMYKAFIEPDLQTAHIKIVNKFNPFTGFQSPTYILKSSKPVTVDQIKAGFSEDLKEGVEQTYDIYLLPPGEDPESCQSYLRMRNREGKYNLMFEVHSTNLSPYNICFKIFN
ncbi:hypothetical protein Cgig2_007858 [Carnegiea gigantea]|uniref:CYTH domain-containing protein n=1 Tax=Carnegiea gigantea TaxID=171969 RepID=A0A9Q1GYE9_9CARY|nr:hypothetical protein Cgig2_007858 [Carnegiea gigantea]